MLCKRTRESLIALQRPDATHVAGFVTWKKLGRYIKSGEKGIAIIAPMIYSIRDETSDENSEKEIRGFRVAYVFDITQTDGKELPEFSKVKGDPRLYSDRLNQLIAEKNINLEYTDHMQADGYSSGDKIVIKRGLSQAEDFAGRVHELAHDLLRQKTDEKLSRKQKKPKRSNMLLVQLSG